MFDPELQSFKTRIDLRPYAAGEGYTLDRKDSWRGSAVMRHANGDKIIITRKPDGVYTFWSVRDDRDHGTILDFIRRRKGLNLGQIRKELRAWTGASSLPAYPPLLATSKDRHRVEVEFAKMEDALRHPYLEDERGIPAELLASERFAGCIRIDKRGNAIFSHVDQIGLCGYEIKNKGFTGFASGGTKALWFSQVRLDDTRLVFCESAIDALSQAYLFPDAHARYASVGGKLNLTQPELIRAAIARTPSGAEILAAFDADQAGRDLAEVVRCATERSGRADLRFRVQEPEGGAKDWNEVLTGRRKLARTSFRQSEARPA